MTTYRTNHYAQRAIFKNWSGLNQQKRLDGFVWHFDFVSRRFERTHSRNVFSRDRLFDEADEKRFNTLVEHPLASFRDAQLRRVRSASETSAAISVDERTLRALSLLWLLNVARFGDAFARDKGLDQPHLSKSLSERGDEDLDQLAELFRQRFHLTLAVVRQHPMFYPEFGSFLLPLLDPGRKREPRLAMAFPLDPNLALVAFPKGWGPEGQDPSMLSAYSVGSGDSRSAIVPAALMEAPENHAAVAEIVLGLRRGVETVFAEIRAFAGKAGHDISAFPVGPSWPT